MRDHNFTGVLILVVDDEADLREVIVDEFKCLGAEVYAAASGDEALALCNSLNIRVVISDIRMPGMSGVDLLRHLRSRGKQPQVILISGYSDYTEESLQALGAFAVLHKPFNFDDLLAYVAEICSGRPESVPAKS
jgi:CheY-like chemotaxis protein